MKKDLQKEEIARLENILVQKYKEVEKERKIMSDFRDKLFYEIGFHSAKAEKEMLTTFEHGITKGLEIAKNLLE